MKRYFIIFIFCFFSFEVFATQNAGFDININKNVTVGVGMLAYGDMSEAYILKQDGLYWDLLIWAENAKNQLVNKTRKIDFFIDPLSNKIEISEWGKIWGKNRKKILKKITYKDESEIKNIILTELNNLYKVNVDINNNTYNSIQVFYVNYENSGLSINKYIHCNNIFFTMEGATDYIKKETEFYQKIDEERNFFIENIVLTKKNIVNIMFVS